VEKFDDPEVGFDEPKFPKRDSTKLVLVKVDLEKAVWESRI
jgi:hypothetical protein